MLRRSPTALTISPEDLTLFEELHARKVAHAHFVKTGQDPNGWFTRDSHANTNSSSPAPDPAKQRIMGGKAAQVGVDPNDELKPLPGDKARIVRRREERVVGPGQGQGHARTQSQGQGGVAAASAGAGAAGGRDLGYGFAR